MMKREVLVIRRDPHRCLIRVRLQPGDETLQIVCRHCLPCEDQERAGRKESHRFEIVQQIILEGVRRTVQDVRVVLAYTQRISVGSRTGDPAGADGTARARYIR